MALPAYPILLMKSWKIYESFLYAGISYGSCSSAPISFPICFVFPLYPLDSFTWIHFLPLSLSSIWLTQITWITPFLLFLAYFLSTPLIVPYFMYSGVLKYSVLITELCGCEEVSVVAFPSMSSQHVYPLKNDPRTRSNGHHLGEDWKCSPLGPTLGLLNLNLHFNEISRWFV